MRIGAAALAGGILGVVGTLCFLVAFGTDYWLVAIENCGQFLQPGIPTQDKDANRTELILHHEGFFWRCMFEVEPSSKASLFSNQPEYKVCIHGYLFPLPVAIGDVPSHIYDATAVFRGFWTLLIIAALVSALTGGSLLICGVPFFSQKLYKVGGAFVIAAAGLFLVMLLLFVLWMEVVDVKRYILQEKGENCPNAEVSIFYGLSFMVAATGIPLEAVSGLLFLMCGRALEARR